VFSNVTLNAISKIKIKIKIFDKKVDKLFKKESVSIHNYYLLRRDIFVNPYNSSYREKTQSCGARERRVHKTQYSPL